MTDDADRVVNDEFEPIRRRLIFCGIGLAQGVAFYLLGEFGGRSPLTAAARLFCGTAPVLVYLTFDRRRWIDFTVFSVALALVAALLHLWIAARVDLQTTQLDPVFVAGALVTSIIAYISLPFFQVWAVSRRLRFPYGDLFGHAWNNGLEIIAAGVFLGVLWLLLALWAALFSLVDLDFFGQLFSMSWFAKPVSGAAFGLGIAMLREHERIIRAIRSLVFALTTALAPVLPAAAVLFLILLPFAGFDTLWRTGYATTILMMVIVVGILIANAVMGDGSNDEPLPRAVALPVMAQLVVLPIFTSLAFYATGLRILQYGLSPDRVYAAVIIFVVGLYAVVYSYAVLRHRWSWGRAIRDYNPVLAAVVVVFAILVQTPLVDPYWLSAYEQYRGLANRRVEPDRFDFGNLKYNLGAPGRRTLDRIRSEADDASTTAVLDRLAALDGSKDYYDWKQTLRRDTQVRSVKRFGLLVDYVLVLPDGKVLPDGFEDYLVRKQPSLLEWCHRAPIERCAVVVADLSGDKRPELVVVRKWGRRRVQFDAYRIEGADWRSYDNWQSTNGDEIWRDLIESKIKVVAPNHRVLKVGDIDVPITPRR